MKLTRNTFLVCLGLVLVSRTGFCQSAYVDFRANYIQSSDNVTAFSDAAFSVDFEADSNSGITGVSLTIPGAASAIELTATPGPNLYDYYSLPTPTGQYSYPTISALYASNPSGAYKFNEMLDYGNANYTVNSNGMLPAPLVLTGTSLETLTESNFFSPITVNFNAVTLDPAALPSSSLDTEAGVFDRSTDQYVTFLAPSSATTFTFPADTFAPGESYEVELIDGNTYSEGTDPDTSAYQNFDVFDFTAGMDVPEPSSAALMAVGFAACFLAAGIRRLCS